MLSIKCVQIWKRDGNCAGKNICERCVRDANLCENVFVPKTGRIKTNFSRNF